MSNESETKHLSTLTKNSVKSSKETNMIHLFHNDTSLIGDVLEKVSVNENTGCWGVVPGSMDLFFASAGHNSLFDISSTENQFENPNLLSRVHPDDREEIRDSVESATDGSVIETTFRGIKDDQEQITKFSVTLQPIYDDSGKLLCVLGLTQAKESSNRVGESQQYLLESIIDSALEGFLIVNDSRDVVLKNDRFVELWGIPDQIVETGDDQKLVEYVLGRVKNPDDFQQKIMDVYDEKTAKSHDLVELEDGRVFERQCNSITDSTGRYIGHAWSFSDVTTSIEYESSLEKLSNAVTGLYEIRNDKEVAERVLEIVDKVLHIDTAAVCCYNPTRDLFHPVAVSGRFDREIDNGSSHFEPGISSISKVFENQTLEVIEGPDNPFSLGFEQSRVVLAPLGEYGVLVLGGEKGRLKSFHVDLIDILSLVACDAFERAEQTHKLRKKQIQLDSKKDMLQRVSELNEEICSVMSAVVNTETIEEVNTSVCDAITRIDGFDCAWIAEVDRSTKDFKINTLSGDSDVSSLFSHEVSKEMVCPDSIVNQNGDPIHLTLSNNDSVDMELWRRISQEGFHSMFSIPIAYAGVNYGTLTVLSREIDGFQDLTKGVLEDIGQILGFAHNTLNQEDALYTGAERTIRLNVEKSDTVFSKIVDQTGGKVITNHLMERSAGETIVYIRVCSVNSTETATQILSECPQVESFECISEEDEPLFEVVLSTNTICSEITKLGTRFKRTEFGPNSFQVTVVLSQDRSPKEFLTQVNDVVDSSVMLSSKKHGDTESAVQQVVLREYLTEKQENVLRTAYHNGYFNKPRERTGSEIADSLGVSQPTFSMSLRAAERNLLESIYEPRED